MYLLSIFDDWIVSWIRIWIYCTVSKVCILLQCLCTVEPDPHHWRIWGRVLTYPHETFPLVQEALTLKTV